MQLKGFKDKNGTASRWTDYSVHRNGNRHPDSSNQVTARLRVDNALPRNLLQTATFIHGNVSYIQDNAHTWQLCSPPSQAPASLPFLEQRQNHAR